jgi:AraC-like DNA-binding protein
MAADEFPASTAVIRSQPRAASHFLHHSFPPILVIDDSATREICRLLTRSRRHALPTPPLAGQLLAALVQEMTMPGPFHSQRVVHLTSGLILELARAVSHHQDKEEAQADERFSALLAKLERECAEPWTLEGMAAELGLRRTQFTELFHHYTGDAPLRCLQRMRVARACHLLRTTQQSITDVALECGFCSSQHLDNVFRKFTAETPSEYRRLGPPELKLPRPQEWK